MDKAKLRYEMERRGVSVAQMCAELKMSRSAFHRKCTGESEFTLREIQAIVDFLGLDSPVGIFFATKVS